MKTPWRFPKPFCMPVFLLLGMMCHAQKIDFTTAWNIADRNSKRVVHTTDTTFFVPATGQHGERDTFAVKVRLHFDSYWFLLMVENAVEDKKVFKIFIHQKEILLTQMIINGEAYMCEGYFSALFHPVYRFLWPTWPKAILILKTIISKNKLFLS
jgi:hypothetical protein